MRRALVVLLALGALAAGCSKQGGTGGSGGAQAALRLGYFPNVTHAQALVGDADGTFQRALGGTPLDAKKFNAGPAAMEALVAGALDASYVGTGPAINTFLKAGRELRVIAGAADGGAVLVVRTARSARELKGKALATPQLGNTQDIALRTWLRAHGLTFGGPDVRGADVTVLPMANPDILAQFQRGRLEGAWVPEPWGARLVAEGHGHILLDERTLWPGGRFPTTVLVTTKRALETRRPQLLALVRAHVALTERWRQDPQGFARATNEAFARLSGKPLPERVLTDALSRVRPTVEPEPDALATAARHAKALGFIPSDDLTGLVDTSLLDEVRRDGVGGSGR